MTERRIMRDETGSQIEVENRLGYIWVILPENLNAANYSDIEKVVLRRLTGKTDHLVFDLTRVKALYSSALGVLIRVRKQVGEAGGVVCLVNVSQTIVTLLESLNLNKIFPIYATDVEFEISEDKAWDQKLSERAIEFIFVAQVEDGIYRISIAGEMVSGHDMSLAARFTPHSTSAKVCILDLSGLMGMDSSGAGVFMGLVDRIKKRGCTCRAFGAIKIVKQVLQFLGIDEQVEFYRKEKEALEGGKKVKKSLDIRD